MLSKEEKRAIETLEIEGTENNYLEVRILLNLVEKQQKEIEEYKEHYENMKWYYDNQKDNLIHKDKIREKIKEYDKWIKEGGDYTESLEAQRYALEELLEEN